MHESLDISKTALELLNRFKSLSAISRNSSELISIYGEEQFQAIYHAAKNIRHATLKQKAIEYAKADRTELQKRLNILKSRFKVNTRYAFIVIEKQRGVIWGRVRDQYGMEHPINMSSRYEVDDCITCNVYGFYAKIQEPGKVVVNLRLDNPRKLQAKNDIYDYEPESAPKYIKSPEKWYAEVIDLGKHKCGKPFTCSCCGRDFPANKGVRVDFKEIYFCNECKKKIYLPSGKGWSGSIIYTPMGNKR